MVIRLFLYSFILISVIIGWVILVAVNKKVNRNLTQVYNDNAIVAQQLEKLLTNHCHEVMEKMQQVERKYTRLINNLEDFINR